MLQLYLYTYTTTQDKKNFLWKYDTHASSYIKNIKSAGTIKKNYVKQINEKKIYILWMDYWKVQENLHCKSKYLIVRGIYYLVSKQYNILNATKILLRQFFLAQESFRQKPNVSAFFFAPVFVILYETKFLEIVWHTETKINFKENTLKPICQNQLIKDSYGFK